MVSGVADDDQWGKPNSLMATDGVITSLSLYNCRSEENDNFIIFYVN